jgi:hypothetical protein
MIAVVIALTAALRSTVRSHADLVVEILAVAISSLSFGARRPSVCAFVGSTGSSESTERPRDSATRKGRYEHPKRATGTILGCSGCHSRLHLGDVHDALALYYPVKPDRVFDSLVLAEDGSNGASNGSRERHGSIRAPGRPWREASVPVAQFARLAACENWQPVSPTGDPGPCPFPPG